MNPEEYRQLFPILQTKIHLGNCSQSPLSLPVMRSLDRYERSLLEDGMDWPRWLEEVHGAKAAFAALIGANVEDIAVLSCVSDAVSTIASCLPIRNRSRIVTTADEFPTVGHAWLAAAARAGTEVVFATAPARIYTRERIEPYIEENTAILSVHLVSYYDATLQDVGALAQMAHSHGALILVDAYQGLGTVPLDVGVTDVDIVVSGNLKYLLGLPGIAFLYVRPELSAELRPGMTGWLGRVNPFDFDPAHLDYAPGGRRFDMGTPPIQAAYAARAGMELIADVGVHEINRHIQELSRHLIEEARYRDLEVVSPLDVQNKGASTAIRAGAHSAQVERQMKQRNVIVSARGDVVRLAPHFFTTMRDIDKALDVLCDIFDAMPEPTRQTQTAPLPRII